MPFDSAMFAQEDFSGFPQAAFTLSTKPFPKAAIQVPSELP